MADEHAEPRAEFPTAMLYGGMILALAIIAVLSVFVFAMGGHGTTPTAPSASQQKR